MPIRILALCGSQRARSMSDGLLRACRDLAPAGVAIDLFEHHKDFPLFNPERADVPPGVRALQAAITAADALLIASPEYAHGVTGTIKNTLDWVVKETLRTMSADLVLDACLRIPVIGSRVDPDRIASEPRFAAPVTAALRALVAHVGRVNNSV